MKKRLFLLTPLLALFLVPNITKVTFAAEATIETASFADMIIRTIDF